MIQKILLAFVSLCVASVFAGIAIGKCPEGPVLKSFDASAYAGSWYEVERFAYVFEEDLICVEATYGLINSTFVSVKNQGYNIMENRTNIVPGYAVITNTSAPNKLVVHLPITFENHTIINNSGPYEVWATDYKTYSLVYSCTNLADKFLRYEVAWILGRTKTLPANTITILKNMLYQYKIDITNFEPVDQTCSNKNRSKNPIKSH